METGLMIKTLCFGGTFNPIHNAHLVCSRAVAERGGFGKVLLIPTRQPPHKPDQSQLGSAENRLAMCQLAIQGDPLFAIDDIEMRRTGPSYTLDTVRALKARGWDQIHWLIGADMLNFLPKWHEPYALLAEVDFVVMARPGFAFDWKTLPEAFRRLRKNVVEAPLIDITATEIRNRVARGESIEDLTPAAVVNYINTHGLYQKPGIIG